MKNSNCFFLSVLNIRSMDNLARKRMTAEEYFALEETSLEKYEFYRGEIFAMSGATRKHNLLVVNLVVQLKNALKNRPCEVYASDMRVMVDEYGHYTYPDLSIVCGKRIFTDEKEVTLVNPIAIAEVLSDSTEGYDRGKKFHAYRNIPSLQVYILISTNYKQIEVFTRLESGTWNLTEPDKEGRIHISPLECSLDLKDVYDQVEIVEEKSQLFSSDDVN